LPLLKFQPSYIHAFQLGLLDKTFTK